MWLTGPVHSLFPAYSPSASCPSKPTRGTKSGETSSGYPALLTPLSHGAGAKIKIKGLCKSRNQIAGSPILDAPRQMGIVTKTATGLNGGRV